MPFRPLDWIPQIGLIFAGHPRPHHATSRRPNGMPYWQLIVTTGGKALWDLPGGQQTQVIRFDLILSRPGVPLYYQPAPPQRRWDCLFAVFQPYPHWMELLDWPEAGAGIVKLRIDDAAAFASIVRGMRQVIRQCEDRHRPQARGMNALERVLLDCDRANRAHQRPRIDPRIQAAVDYMNGQRHRHVSVDELAQAVHMSASRLAHLFRQQMRLSPLEYHDRGRMGRACQLLSGTDTPIKQIGEAVGYPQPYHFATRFRKLIGQSPSKYRREGNE